MQSEALTLTSSKASVQVRQVLGLGFNTMLKDVMTQLPAVEFGIKAHAWHVRHAYYRATRF